MCHYFNCICINTYDCVSPCGKSNSITSTSPSLLWTWAANRRISHLRREWDIRTTRWLIQWLRWLRTPPLIVSLTGEGLLPTWVSHRSCFKLIFPLWKNEQCSGHRVGAPACRTEAKGSDGALSHTQLMIPNQNNCNTMPVTFAWFGWLLKALAFDSALSFSASVSALVCVSC